MEKIKQIIDNVKNKFHEICNKIKNIKHEAEFYKGLWDQPQTKSAVKHGLNEIWFLLKKIKPANIEGDVTLGTGDPASTGQVIGAVAALYGLIPEKLHITPDFEEKKYEGNIYVKGKLRLIQIVVIAVRLIADKNVRYVIRKFQSKEDVKNEQQ